jgi:signal transduction histidine kinase
MDSGGIGLIGMRERVRFCGGLLSVKSAPDLGTEITAEVAVAGDTAAIAND